MKSKLITVAVAALEVVSIGTANADEPPQNLIAEVIDSGHSRVPLWRDQAENIVGILHARDAVRGRSCCSRRWMC